jgi:molecular chaperone DnaK (HSP70)
MSNEASLRSPAEPRAATTRYVVGIDLGTTHTVVGYVDGTRKHDAPGGQETEQTRPRIEVFPLPQLVAPGEVGARPLLPSFRFHPAENELTDAELSPGFPDPLPDLPRGVVGTLAQALGRRVPGRLIASAKSWLCHGAVDREAAILPWGAGEGVAKISPVDASASYLAHVRAAWNQAHPRDPLEQQEVVLTVPASFDEAARALTLQAARHAGLPRVRLLEEPQAAFYDWLDRHRDTLARDLAGVSVAGPDGSAVAHSPVRLALVVDVGGGTTDLTLIHVELRDSGPRLTRIAVGDHLMLGGDNMDLTLARVSEAALLPPGERLPAARLSQLVEQCREAKEKLLGEHAPEQASLSILGSGSKLIGGTKTTTFSRERVLELVVDGFMPRVSLDDKPDTRRSGFVEFGLPYVADPAITKHIAQFLTRHRGVTAEALGLSADEAASNPLKLLPDAVLFNGGVFRGAALKQRLSEVLASYRGQALHELDNHEPELAVARGAVAYGLARRGVGLRIGGGSPRSYYLEVDTSTAEKTGVCVLPRGAEEGEDITLKGRTFALRVGKPVRFRLWTSTSERSHRAGEIVTLDNSFHELPDIAAVLDAKSGQNELKVELHTGLTELGTLEMSCVALVSDAGSTPAAQARSGDDARSRYKLEFELRGQARRDSTIPETRVTQLHPRFAEATELVQAFFGKANKELEGRKIKTLRTDLEKILGERDGWDTALLRELFSALMAGKKGRRRTADHERVWLNLTGFALRPGFGYPLDPFRVDQVWALYSEGVQFAPDAQVWSQWWILFRRIAGGLDEARQNQLLDDLSFYLEPPGPRPKPRPKGPKALGLEDMVRLSGSLERVSAERKVKLGGWLLARLGSSELSPGSVWWTMGRIGARAPLYGSAHTVVPPQIAATWLEQGLRAAQSLRAASDVEQVSLALGQLARLTHDRARDVSPELRERAASAIARTTGNDTWVKLVREGGELSESDRGRVFGESLPSGLRLTD